MYIESNQTENSTKNSTENLADLKLFYHYMRRLLILFGVNGQDLYHLIVRTEVECCDACSCRRQEWKDVEKNCDSDLIRSLHSEGKLT